MVVHIKKIKIHYLVMYGLFSILLVIIVNKYLYSHHKYANLLKEKTYISVEGLDAPRGRIYDKNGLVLVDNILINNLVFYNIKGINKKDVAKELSVIIPFEKANDNELLLWYKDYYNSNKLLTKKEVSLVKQRKMSIKEKDNIINSKILSLSFTDEEKRLAKVYALLNKGYDYEPKLIYQELSDEMVAKIIEKNITGIKIEQGTKRYYPYGETLRSILGNIGKITKDNKIEYLKKGYNLNDEVGISYLEKYYDKYLKGTKAKYKVNNDNSLKMLKPAQKGNDIYLSIDINMQEKIDSIIEDNILKAKKYPNTEYLSDSYVIVSKPKTGEIISISGKRLINNSFTDVTVNNITSSFTMGSVVKGATISVGYQNNLINPDEKIYDSCVKLKSLTEKCSWKKLGYLDSVTALEQSSNYYQFLIAIKLAGQKYIPDMNLNVTNKEFDIYRKMLSSYGLGVKTGIDLPNEKIGLIGSKISPDLLLNLAIGQYDTYTPIELLTYINTIGNNGIRHKPSLVRSIVNKKKTIYENKYLEEGKVDVSDDDISLIQKGFYYVMNRGTGNGFMNKKLSPAGKTGTSESFLDTNDDGIVDSSSLTLTLAGYFPYENPEYSIIIICPNASRKNEGYDYIYYLTAMISNDITSYIASNY